MLPYIKPLHQRTPTEHEQAKKNQFKYNYAIKKLEKKQEGCADCTNQTMGWIALPHGIFICSDCALIHQSLGEQISILKSYQNETSYWFQDEMEWGPRALGNRSFLADPRNIDIKEIINLKIKKREKFRPFAPSILKEHSSRYFNKEIDSPYMNQVFKCNDVAKKEIKGVVHIDNTCRVHTVESSSNLKFYNLIHKFYEETGVPSLLNTSLNLHGYPIVNNAEDLIFVLENSELDGCILKNSIILR